LILTKEIYTRTTDNSSAASYLAFGSALLLVLGIAWSPFLLSLSQIGLLVAGLWQAHAHFHVAQPQAGWGGAIIGTLLLSLRRWWQAPVLVALSLLFVVPALSYFWTEYTAGWSNFTRIRLPFLILPWAFANLPTLTAAQYKTVLYALVWTMAVLCVGVGIHFALNSEAILDGLGHGQPVPVPRSHIRFSLLVAVSILSGGWLWWQRFRLRFDWERPLLGAVVLFLFVFIHILSVRSGIAALYGALFFTIFWVIWQTGHWKIGLVALALMVILPVVAVQSIPSLHNRISYMRYDWERFKNKEGGSYSDADRWVSLQAGLLLWGEQPLMGVGTGDLQMEVQRVANVHFPRYSLDTKMPHNQFLFMLAGTGLLGLGLSLCGLLAPLTQSRVRRFYLFSVFQVVVFLSFMVEYTLETAVGVAFYLFFTLFFREMSLKSH
jgi:O-antigen ligase